MVELPELAGVHLVLADARAQDRVVRVAVAQLFHHELRLELVARQRILVDERELLLPTGDGGAPVGAVGLGRGTEFLRGLDEPLDDELAVALDADVVLPDLAELRRVDVDMDDLRRGGEAVELAGDTIVEAGTERDEKVALLHGGDSGVVAVHAGHAEAELVAIRERTPGHQGGDDRDLQQFGEFEQRFGGPGLEHTTADIEHRPLGLGDQGSGFFDEGRVALHDGPVAGQLHRDGIRVVPGHRRLRVGRVDDVFRNIDQHGAGAARGRNVERLVDDPRDVLGVGDEEVVLGHRHRDAGGVALLERVGADCGKRNLAGDAHHRNRIEHGIGERGDDIGCSRAGGDHAHPGFAGGVGVPLGHVAGALLVTHEHVADRRIEDRVVDRQDRAAGQAEHHVDTLVLEGFHQCFATVVGVGARHEMGFQMLDAERRTKTTGRERRIVRKRQRPPVVGRSRHTIRSVGEARTCASGLLLREGRKRCSRRSV